MGGQTREQEYTYQYKSISVGNNAFTCGYGATVNFRLPQNFIEAKNAFMYIVVDFDPAEPLANRKITAVGSPTYPPDGPQPNMLTVNKVYDPVFTQRVEFKIDLTQIIKKLQVVPPALGSQGYMPIGIKHPLLTYTATIKLWKVELVYTTQGIR